jgi:hypothetical protein
MDYARTRERQLREARHSGRIGDRQHVVRPPQPSGRKSCNSVVTISLSRPLTRRELGELNQMLREIKGIIAIDFQGGNVLCAIDLVSMGMNLATCEVMLQEQVDRALE